MSSELARWPAGMRSPATQEKALLEAWGDLVPWTEYPQNDWDAGVRPSAAYSQPRDRSDGRFLPVYETELDLLRQRAICRSLAELGGIGKGAATAMCNYTIGTGIKISVRPAEGHSPDKSLLQEVSAFVRDFAETNRISGSLDREVDEYARQDGERLLVLDGKAHELMIRTIEPEWIAEPGQARDLEEWLDCDFVSSWSFGVHTKKGDAANPLGFHVVYDDRDWDYFPAARAEFWKRNVPRSAKRGVSDFFPVFRDMSHESKIANNAAVGSAARAAIAWIEEMAEGVTLAGATGGRVDALFNRPVSAPGALTSHVSTRMSEYLAGTKLKIPHGKRYISGPKGEDIEGNMAVAQYVLRRIGVRWNAPEYLISGDASNGNYASSLVAESPFVKGREADQGSHRAGWVSLLWKAIRIGYEAGQFGAAVPWGAIRRTLEIAVEFPDVASRDEAALTTAVVAQRDAGLISDRTASTRLGNDYDQERQLGAKRVEAVSPFGPAPAVLPEGSRTAVGNLLRQEWAAYP